MRRWLTERAYVNPSNLDISRGAYYTEWGIPWQILRCVNTEEMANFSRFYLLSKDGSVPGYNSQMVLQPEMGLGFFATMSTGGSRQGQFFSDVLNAFGFKVLPKFYQHLQAQPQPSKLPPAPNDYIGEYGTKLGGVQPVALKIGRSSGGALGDNVLYALTNTGLGWPVSQPLGWVRGDVFEMLPLPADLCFTIQGGDNWNVRFERDGSKVVSVTVEGMGYTPFVLEKL